MKIILVTGGAGFIGSYVCRSLIEGGYKVVVYDAFIQYVSPFESKYQQFLNSRFLGIKDNIHFVRGDIRDKNDIRRTLEEWKPNVVIHLANLPIADLSFTHTEETISSILNSAINILDAIKEKNYVERFVYASSSMVYGDFIETPISEEALKRPKDIYGGTKLAAEILIETYGSV